MNAKASPPSLLGPVLQPFVERRALAGAVTVVADARSVLSMDAVGFADVANGRPMRADTLFWIASQSKSVTASLVMMLVDEGKVRLNDPVQAYLPEFKDQWVIAEQSPAGLRLRKPARPVTLRHLLSHTSGMPFKSAIETPTRDRIPLETTVRSYAMTPLQTEPGARYLYSNAGINTAARVVEVVSGSPFEVFLQTRLLDPLGMSETAFRPSSRQLKRLAKPYKADAAGTGIEETLISQLSRPYDDPERQPMPAGGLFSTAPDVARFCRMILNNGVLDGRRYLSPSAIRQMAHKQTGSGVTERYGLGWSVRGSSCSHGGAFSTHMTVDFKAGLVLVFLVQHADFPNDGGKALGAFLDAARKRF